MSRGFACIGLDNPKSDKNVGGVMRASFAFDASLVIIAGQRFKRFKQDPTDTVSAWRHVPVIETPDLFDVVPHDCVPVAIDLIDGAATLTTYQHPERAFYIFGAEDRTLGARITSRCRDVVYVPTRVCMNLAATVNVVLYDRMLKREREAKRLARATRVAA